MLHEAPPAVPQQRRDALDDGTREDPGRHVPRGARDQGEPPRAGSTVKPIELKTAPRAGQRNRGSTRIPATTRRVAGPTRGIAPMRAPGVSRTYTSESAQTSAWRRSRCMEGALAWRKGSTHRSPEAPMA